VGEEDPFRKDTVLDVIENRTGIEFS
jgi:hypothetical protein